MSISTQAEFFKEVKKHPDRFYVIHYSCQNLNDENEGLSPRVTSIAIIYYANDQAVVSRLIQLLKSLELRVPMSLLASTKSRPDCSKISTRSSVKEGINTGCIGI
jgi:hypothetical protein